MRWGLIGILYLLQPICCGLLTCRLMAQNCELTAAEKDHFFAHILANEGNGDGAWGVAHSASGTTYPVEVIRYGKTSFLHEPGKPFFIVVDLSRVWDDATEVYQCCTYSQSREGWTVGVDEFLEVRAIRGTSSVGVVDARIRTRRAGGTAFVPGLAGPCLTSVATGDLDRANVLGDPSARERIEELVMRVAQSELKQLGWQYRKLKRIELGPAYKSAKSIAGRLISDEGNVGTQYFSARVDMRGDIRVTDLMIAPSQQSAARSFAQLGAKDVTTVRLKRTMSE